MWNFIFFHRAVLYYFHVCLCLSVCLSVNIHVCICVMFTSSAIPCPFMYGMEHSSTYFAPIWPYYTKTGDTVEWTTFNIQCNHGYVWSESSNHSRRGSITCQLGGNWTPGKCVGENTCLLKICNITKQLYLLYTFFTHTQTPACAVHWYQAPIASDSWGTPTFLDFCRF